MAWVASEQADWERQQRGEWPPIRSCDEILADPEPPEWLRRDMEETYRRGFLYGVITAARLVHWLCSPKGFTRPREIASILEYWSETTLRRWKNKALHEQPLVWDGEPSLKIDSWSEIRQKVFAIHGRQCQRCGSVEKIEIHHVESVRNGGLPELENLIPLCQSCHNQE